MKKKELQKFRAQKKICAKCKYSAHISGIPETSVACMYIVMEKKRRGCSMYKCDKYIEGSYKWDNSVLFENKWGDE